MKTIPCLTLTLFTFVMLAIVPNSFAQDDSPEYVVRVIYFIPNDRQPEPDIDTKLDKLIKDAQKFYAGQMEAHGFENKTFRFEKDDDGNAKVHHVTGKLKDVDYQNPAGPRKVFDEIAEQFDTSKNIYFIALGISTKYLDGDPNIFGRGSGNSQNGWVIVPASYPNADWHELGHAFGLRHDSRVDANLIFIYQQFRDVMTSSFCAAEWLDVNRYFNTTQEAFNENTRVEMLTPSLALPPVGIRLKFEVTDPDGLHQVQLYKPYGGYPSIIAYQSLNGKRATVEFVTNELIDGLDIVLRVIDKHGNFMSGSLPIEITDLLLPTGTEAISIPDARLAAEIREILGLTPDHTITQLDMLRLTDFSYTSRNDDTVIRDFTGLEYAIHLKRLYLKHNPIGDFSPLENLTNLEELTVREVAGGGHQTNDFSPLENLINLRVLDLGWSVIKDNTSLEKLGKSIEKLTNLEKLELRFNNFSDIGPLKNLNSLEELLIAGNGIEDISPLKNLTKLKRLRLYDNLIRDISPLKNLTNLEELSISDNPIRDHSPLKNLTKLKDLRGFRIRISDLSPLKNLTNLERLYLHNYEFEKSHPNRNQITDISPLKNLTKLKDLTLVDNQISDITPLAGLTNLRYLSIHENKISDPSPIVGLTNLRRVSLAKNQISDVSSLENLKITEVLNLNGNPIKDIQPLFTILRNNPGVKIWIHYHKKPLPVTLSHFRAEHTDTDVVINWTTESEVDNAGFYIYRSETKDGEFKVINPSMIQGAGTTGERNEYTWTDTTAKPNTVYYYRIEDVSFAGVRQVLATTKLKGLISAKNKFTTRWGDLKSRD